MSERPVLGAGMDEHVPVVAVGSPRRHRREAVPVQVDAVRTAAVLVAVVSERILGAGMDVPVRRVAVVRRGASGPDESPVPVASKAPACG